MKLKTYILGAIAVFAACAILGANPSMAAERGAMEPLEAAGTFMDDTAITAEVKLRLAGQKGLDSAAIHVTTTDAVVTLDGTVSNVAEAELAERVARDLDNIKGVTNKLEVKGASGK